jgi:SAM-dependent methyltransferase
MALLFRAFRKEISDPEYFYGVQATDTALQIAPYVELSGATVVDVGGGAGFFSNEFQRRGATCVLIEPFAEPMGDEPTSFDDAQERHDYLVAAGRLMPGRTIAGDGMALGLGDDVADLAFSSNVLEHVARPDALLREMWRVTKPGGVVYVSYTLWWGLWGGHETSPWHFLGGAYAARRYERRHGRRPGNYFGESLFGYRVGPILNMARRLPHDQLHVFPRYYPRWLHWVIWIPGLRELVAWNLVLVLRKPAR